MRIKITCILLLISFCLQAQVSGDYPPNAEAGKCYAKCFLPGKEVIKDQKYAVYIGQDTTNPALQLRTVDVDQSGQRQTKQLRLADKHTPAAEFEIQTMQVYTREKSTFSEWREVICGDKLSKKKITEIQVALHARGYETGSSGDGLSDIKPALVKFQKDNQLSEGGFSIESLKALGVKY
jgi:hypothetical protein